MGSMHETAKVKERGVVVAVAEKNTSDERISEYLEELVFLAQTLDIDTDKRFVQKLDHPDPRRPQVDANRTGSL